MNKMSNNDAQNTTQTTKELATQTPLNIGVNSGAPEGKAVPAPHMLPVVLLLLQNR